MVTKNGTVKKTLLSDFANVRKNGLIAINLVDGDKLIEVKCTNAESEIFLVTKQGMCIRFHETDVRRTGRSSIGVIGMNLNPGDEIIGMQLASQGTELLFISERGYGKRTLMNEFTAQKRGGKGVKCYKIVEKTGDVMGVKAIDGSEEIIMMTTEGIMIRIEVSDINTLSRITSGVKLMNLPNGVKIAQAAKVRDRLSNGEKDFDSVEEAEAEVDAEETEFAGNADLDEEDDEETKKFHGEDEENSSEDDE
jgi:DNA gyrase subunit A